jgi:hypothetical protein
VRTRRGGIRRLSTQSGTSLGEGSFCGVEGGTCVGGLLGLGAGSMYGTFFGDLGSRGTGRGIFMGSAGVSGLTGVGGLLGSTVGAER